MAAPSQINSESKANGNATLMPDIKDDARAPNGSTKVIVKPDAGLRSQEHCMHVTDRITSTLSRQ